jgi:hypothetical protein
MSLDVLLQKNVAFIPVRNIQTQHNAKADSCRLFSDFTEPNTLFSVEVEVEDAKDLYKEVLLTYRLLFGQDRSSYEHFNALRRKGELVSKKDPDVLLATLCGESCESKDARLVYEMVEAEEPLPQYSPSDDFPFLGRRLLNIQKYVRGHNSNTIRAIWHDRRNPLAWWTFWVCNTPRRYILALN